MKSMTMNVHGAVGAVNRHRWGLGIQAVRATGVVYVKLGRRLSQELL